MVNRNRGVTLIELLVVTALSGILILAISSAFSLLANQYANIQTNVGKESSIQSLLGQLQKYMAPGDIRFLGFSGKGPADKVLARVLVPQPGLCGNLTAGCTNDTAFLYVHHYRETSPALTALCFMDTAHVVIDTHDPTYGTATYSAGTFQVSSASSAVGGNLAVPTDTLLAIGNAPVLTLWVTTGTPTVRPISAFGSPVVFSPALPSDCIANLSNRGNDVSGLVSIPVKPFLLTQFTGGSTVSASDITTSLGASPFQVISPTLRSVGRLASNSTGGIFTCPLVGGAIRCSATPISSVQNVARFRVENIYKQALGAYTNTRYDVINPTMTQDSACAVPDCQTLPLATDSAIPVLWDPVTHTETYTTLSSAGFSLLKQDLLSRLRFVISWTDNSPEGTADVVFP